jgi:chromosome segregation ATPase
MKFASQAFLMMAFLFTGIATAQQSADRCQRRKNKLAEFKSQSQNLYQRQVQTERRIEELKRNLNRLQADRSQIVNEKAALDRRISRTERRLKRHCRYLEACGRYEQQISALKDSMLEHSTRLESIRHDIRLRHQESNDLDRDIEEIENTFNRLHCDNLQIGRTPQSTFDQCSRLSEDFNKINRRINSLHSLMQHLRRRYSRIMKTHQNTNTQIAQLTQKMRRQCTHSNKLIELEELGRRHHEYQELGDELDQVDSLVKRFRASKLHRLKPVRQPKKKHTLKPVR